MGDVIVGTASKQTRFEAARGMLVPVSHLAGAEIELGTFLIAGIQAPLEVS
jgi:hypothetical protein